MKKRIAAVIIQDKKLLLVTDKDAYCYWTPGGKPDYIDTNDVDTIRRELFEELNIRLSDGGTYYGSAIDKPRKGGFMEMENIFYLCKITGQLKPSAEISIFTWLSKENFLEGKLAITSGTRDYLIPKLIKDGLL